MTDYIINSNTVSFEQPSVFKGEVAFLTFTVEGKVVGELWGTDGVLSFKGDCDASAKIFFEQVIEINRSLLQK